MYLKIALIGNPNVGKNTVFNKLTRSHQDSNNLEKITKKTKGIYKNKYLISNYPSIYSIKEVKNLIDYDAIIIMCDATCLEKNLMLVLQTLELTSKVVVGINFMDEAKRRKISINFKKLKKILKVPIVKTIAIKNKGLKELIEATSKINNNDKAYQITYPKEIENYKNELKNNYHDYKISLLEQGITINKLNELIITSINKEATKIYQMTVIDSKTNNQIIDKILTGKYTKIPVMLMLLSLIFYLTIIGSNYPSDWLFNFFNKVKTVLFNSLPENFITKLLIDGAYQVTTWVVAVMLPPMLIFFPLFTLLEDSGILMRFAFNLDHYFKKCETCGKQALTMAMGLGCNAVAITSSKMIKSKKERLIAIVTNSMVPCNGRFPTLIIIISIFLCTNSILKALFFTVLILLSVFISLLTSKILAKTILRDVKSSFVLELPSYHRPQIILTIIKSLKDKLIFVLFRALIVAMPAGVIIFLLANIKLGDLSLLSYLANLLNPIGNLFGLDGAIILGFILGFPANEIVLPIILMIYLSSSTLVDITNLDQLKQIFINNNWNIITAICFTIFSLFHYPCSTSCLTIRKETNNKWMLVSIIVPLIIGLTLCFITANVLGYFIK